MNASDTRAMQRRDVLWGLTLALSGCTLQRLAVVQPERAISDPAAHARVRAPAVGQQWGYGKYNVYNSELVATELHRVQAMEPQVVIESRSPAGVLLGVERHAPWGQLLQDPAWDMTQRLERPVPLWPAVLAPGVHESIRARYQTESGSFFYWIQVQTTVAAWERLSLPIGAWDVWRIERHIRLAHPDASRIETVRRDTLWLSPELGRWVLRETVGQYRISGGRKVNWFNEDHFRWELQSWQPGG